MVEDEIDKHFVGTSRQQKITAHSMDDFDARKEVLRSKYGCYFKSFEHHAETIWKFQVLPGIESEHKCGYNITK